MAHDVIIDSIGGCDKTPELLTDLDLPSAHQRESPIESAVEVG